MHTPPIVVSLLFLQHARPTTAHAQTGVWMKEERKRVWTTFPLADIRS